MLSADTDARFSWLAGAIAMLLLAAPSAAAAQQTQKMPRVGIISEGDSGPSPTRERFEGQTVTWQPMKDGFVLAPTHLDTINLNDGDIIMQMLDPSGKQFVWIRLLRRIGTASD